MPSETLRPTGAGPSYAIMMIAMPQRQVIDPTTGAGPSYEGIVRVHSVDQF